MKKLILLAALMLLSTPALASHQKFIDIKVNGMVCDFCAQSVFKVFKDYDAVEDIMIDLDTGMVSLDLKEGQDLTQEELDKGITYAGYQLVGITRRDEGHE